MRISKSGSNSNFRLGFPRTSRTDRAAEVRRNLSPSERSKDGMDKRGVLWCAGGGWRRGRGKNRRGDLTTSGSFFRKGPPSSPRKLISWGHRSTTFASAIRPRDRFLWWLLAFCWCDACVFDCGIRRDDGEVCQRQDGDRQTVLGNGRPGDQKSGSCNFRTAIYVRNDST